MTTTYKLPDWLGGLDFGNPLPVREKSGWVSGLVTNGDTTWVMDVPRDLLVEVKPPMPDEPANGYVGIENDEGSTYVWQRDDRDADWDTSRWWGSGFESPCTWKELCERLQGRTLTELIPDPTANAPKLPWRPAGIYSITVETNKPEGPGLYFDSSGAVDDPDELDQLAAICMRRARDIRTAQVTA